ncbi:hypothetical protein [Methanolapillus millepedarum]|uniref:Uncharacterized protein n=1 Tax=Methanolapillus millepedarum TaxID=3028296 RepID=A0AA96ZVF8_9EURY|nr:hypothetical protein MsAc7_09360 [Methanosarcinaceae archaeon Ac7]
MNENKNNINQIIKQMLTSVAVFSYYFLALFFTGYVITVCISWILVSLFEPADPVKIITLTGLGVMSVLALTDMVMVFSKKVSLGIIVMSVPYIVFLSAKSALNKTSEFAAGSVKEIAKSVVYNDKGSKYDIRSNTYVISNVFMNRHNNQHHQHNKQ